jgi:hypothetical protein
MATQLQAGETLVREGPANLQRGVETVGGRLYLTSARLVFESHRFNVQKGPTSVSLRDVVGVRKCWTKFLGVLPLFPNSVALETTGGETLRIVVAGRASWIGAIETARSQHVSA